MPKWSSAGGRATRSDEPREANVTDATGPGPLIVAASPRPGGNSDRAADILAEAAAVAASGAGGAHPEVVRLRDYGVLPCLGCGHCARHPGICVRDGRDRAPGQAPDRAMELFVRLMDAPWVAVAAPIFFYHLPAQLKAWIDRSQRHYLMRQRGDPAVSGLAERPAYACLVAGRPRGERLFDGALLTLRYFLDVYNLTLADTVTLRGLDAPGDLEADPGAVRALEDLGRAAAMGRRG